MPSSVKSSSQVIILTSVGIGVISSPSALWSTLNTIQLISNMPLNSVPYSSKLKQTSSALTISSFLPNPISKYLNKEATTKPKGRIKEFGIESSAILYNISQVWVIFLILIFTIIIILVLSKIFTNSNRLQNCKIKFKYNLMIRFFIQSYLEFCIYGFIQVREVRFI